ncbi:MAG: hypothetical protein AMXMBFR59_07500 [Rhodanobacteraceae bacterium]
MAHEILVAFAHAGLPLCGKLVEMLDEHFSHHTERRGCGFTQATRHLSTFINAPRDPVLAGDLGLFASWPKADTEHLAARLLDAGSPHGWRALDQVDERQTRDAGDAELQGQLRALRPRLMRIRDALAFEESRLFVDLVIDLLGGSERHAPDLPPMPEKPSIGSCSQAEEFFLEIAQTRIRRGGTVNTVVDGNGQPLLLEKVGIGESHSALVINPVRINRVWIPPGGLCAIRYVEPLPELAPTRHGLCLPIPVLAEVRFLRLTTLAVAPESRRRAFLHQVNSQIQANMLSPLTCTMQQLRDVAEQQLAVSA